MVDGTNANARSLRNCLTACQVGYEGSPEFVVPALGEHLLAIIADGAEGYGDEVAADDAEVGVFGEVLASDAGVWAWQEDFSWAESDGHADLLGSFEPE